MSVLSWTVAIGSLELKLEVTVGARAVKTRGSVIVGSLPPGTGVVRESGGGAVLARVGASVGASGAAVRFDVKPVAAGVVGKLDIAVGVSPSEGVKTTRAGLVG